MWLQNEMQHQLYGKVSATNRLCLPKADTLFAVSCICFIWPFKSGTQNSDMINAMPDLKAIKKNISNPFAGVTPYEKGSKQLNF